jgi:hypothetical protein
LRPAFLPLVAAAALPLVAAKAPEERMISYKMAPVLEPDGTRTLEVKMRFRGDADGVTTLELPSSWAGADELWRHVERLEIRGAERLAGFYDAPVIHHRPGARIKVRYKLVSAWQEDPGFDYDKARPMVRPDWFFVHGEGVFALPQGREAAPARFRWGRIPKGWKVASDLDHLRREPSTAANLINSVAIGGRDLQVIEKTLGRSPLRLAILGKWEFEPQALADTIAPIVAATDAFWGEESTPFLVAMAPLGTLPSGLSYTGTGPHRRLLDRLDQRIPAEGRQALPRPRIYAQLGADHARHQPRDRRARLLVQRRLRRLTSPQRCCSARASGRSRSSSPTRTRRLLRYGTSAAKTVDAEEVAIRFWMDPAGAAGELRPRPPPRRQGGRRDRDPDRRRAEPRFSAARPARQRRRQPRARHHLCSAAS